MRVYTLKILNNAVLDLGVSGNYIRVRSISTASATLNIVNTDTGESLEMSQGDDAQINNFQRLRISHDQGTEQTIKLMVATDKKAGAAQISGAVTLSGGVTVSSLAPVRGTGANANPAVTTTSAQLVASNSSRNYLLVQNKSATGTIYLSFAVAATVANGIRLKPGESYELNCNVLTEAVNAIGDIASNPDVVVVTG